jgi:hypothetical protein
MNIITKSICASLFSILLAACGSAPVDPGQAESTNSAGIPAGRAFVASNGALDQALHLVARKYYNNDSEVLSLYEPTPGSFMVSAAGEPAGGHSVLANPTSDVLSELWAQVADTRPEPLAGSAERIGLESAESRNRTVTSAAWAELLAKKAALQTKSDVLQSNLPVVPVQFNYCNTNFLRDFTTFSNQPSNAWYVLRFNSSLPLYVSDYYEGIPASTDQTYIQQGTVQAGIAVCNIEEGAHVFGPANSNIDVVLNPGSYAVWYYVSGWNCGWNASCCFSGPRCQQCSVPGLSGAWDILSWEPYSTAVVYYSYSTSSYCEGSLPGESDGLTP